MVLGLLHETGFNGYPGKYEFSLSNLFSDTRRLIGFWFIGVHRNGNVSVTYVTLTYEGKETYVGDPQFVGQFQHTLNSNYMANYSYIYKMNHI